MKFFLIMLSQLIFMGSLRAEECTHMLKFALDTDPNHAKGLSGDTNAAYGLMSFMGNPNRKFVIKGEFPKARFLSIESEETQMEKKVDGILDFNIEPDDGSLNPFRENVDMNTPHRSYTVEALSYDVPTSRKNILRLPNNRRIHNLMFRIYSPSSGVTLTKESFPRIFAVNANTGAPMSCPTKVYHDFYFHFPQILTAIIPRLEKFAFQRADIAWGPNSAIPYYLWGGNRMHKGSEVVLVKFKKPTYTQTFGGVGEFDNLGETRYWSLCAQNIVNNETLACVPDYLAKSDERGIATVVFGTGPGVRQAAEKMNFNFIEDTRSWRQFAIVFAYRNVLPKKDFADHDMYKGEYEPRGVLCSRQEFLRGDCQSKFD